MHIKMARDLEEKLKDANTTLFIREKMLISKDSFISELEEALQKSQNDLVNAKLSVNSEAKHVKELQTQLYELETKLLERPSSSELEAAKKSEEKHIELIKTLEEQLKAAESNHNSESSRLEDANAEIEILKSQYKKLQNELSDTQKEAIINDYSNVDNNVVENFANQ